MAIYIARRIIISALLFFMFIVTSICNNVLNISIVSMIDRNYTTSNNSSSLNDTDDNQNKLHWDAFSIALVQGAYFWGNCATKLPGGLLSRRYGSRRVCMLSVFIVGVTSLVLPISAKIHPFFTFFIRVIQGMGTGFLWPAAVSLGAKWIPTCERGLFTNIFQGGNLGIVIYYPLCGFMIYYYGWESVFYVAGILSFIWLIFWYYYAYDSPNIHPTISCEEKAYLKGEITGIANENNKNANQSLSLIPWKSMITSTAFWATTIYLHGELWSSVTLSIQLPKYFAFAHNVDIQTSGVMIGLPSICNVIAGPCFGYYMDYLIRQKKCSVTRARKISTVTSKIIPGIISLIMASYTHSNYLISVILVAIYYAFNGTSTSAGIANASDIAPNFAGIVLGLIITTIFIPGVISPIIYSSILISDPYNAWFWIFTITASIELISGVFFLIFGTAKIQEWNELKKKPVDV